MKKIKRFAPPGFNLELELVVLILVAAFTVLFLPLGRFYEYLAKAEEYVRIGGTVEPFSRVAVHSFVYVGYLIISCGAFIRNHYRYITNDSKSIYTLKRMSDKHEVAKRCLTIPVTIFIISAVIMIALLIIFKNSYDKRIALLALKIVSGRVMTC